jgi:hypothetical protein
MTNRNKVALALTASLALPLLAASVVPAALALPLSVLVPFVALSHLEGLGRDALA